MLQIDLLGRQLRRKWPAGRRENGSSAIDIRKSSSATPEQADMAKKKTADDERPEQAAIDK